ncbi:MAG: hypothetical protein K5853_00050, partial [Lachnospiraceae bacterium]|nr:hypothetical protein [Lachnospiraceae bacterium]
IGPLIAEAIKKHILSDNDMERELSTLIARTNDVFDKITMDETGLFKMVYASAVKGTEVLICNPKYMQLGDRIADAVKYYASGASVIVSDKLSGALNVKDLDKINKLAPGLLEYIPTLVSMTVSMAIIITLDKNPLLIALTDRFNEVPTITGNIALYRESAEQFERLAAELAKIDYEELEKEIAFYDELSSKIARIEDANVLSDFLINYYKTSGKELPWGNRTIEEHWADPSSRLVFK